ncbi:MAG: hypothetical protein WD002_06030 [Pseudomonadales bacterium]
MINIVGEVVAKGTQGTLIRFPVTGCTSCHNPCSKSKEVLLAGVWETRPRLIVSGRSYCRILANSLGFPLAGFIVGAMVVHYASVSDVATFAGAVAGLLFGILICRGQSLDQIQILEAQSNA